MQTNDLSRTDLPKTDAAVATLALKAMSLGKRLAVEYHGEGRIVEVHAVGVSSKGKPCMRVFQVIGGAVFSEISGWKMLSLTDVENAHILDSDSEGPRPGYQPGDKGMGTILAEISSEPVPDQEAS